MTSENLKNLEKAGSLNLEEPDKKEFEGLLQSAEDRLNDVLTQSLSYSSRFDLCYNAAHAISLAALRFNGYRANNKRYLVFQCLPHTLGLTTLKYRIFDICHQRRNLAEYEGHLEIDEQLLSELISAHRKFSY